MCGFPNICTTHTCEDKIREIIRMVAMFRCINPTEDIRMAAGRNYFGDGGRRLFRSGVNATITGDMLTTVGNNTKRVSRC